MKTRRDACNGTIILTIMTVPPEFQPLNGHTYIIKTMRKRRGKDRRQSKSEDCHGQGNKETKNKSNFYWSIYGRIAPKKVGRYGGSTFVHSVIWLITFTPSSLRRV